MHPTCSAPRPRGTLSRASTGALLGPTEDHTYHDVHHILVLAAFGCITGGEPDRQEQGHPPSSSSLLLGTTHDTGGLGYPKHH